MQTRYDVKTLFNMIEMGDKKFPEQIHITELNPSNFVEFLSILQLNPNIKSISVDSIKNAENISSDDAKMITAVVQVNKTLEHLYFGKDFIPEEAIKPFLKVFNASDFKKLQFNSTERANARLKQLQKNTEWLNIVSLYLIEKQLNAHKKLTNDTIILSGFFSLEEKIKLGRDAESVLDEYFLICENNNTLTSDLSNLKKIINEMKVFCSEQGITPIQFLTYQGMYEDVLELSKQGHLEMIRALNFKNEPAFIFCLHDKISIDLKIQFFKFFESMALDLNATTNVGYNAMHYAVLSKDKDIISYLYHHGVDINAQSIYGHTPLALSILTNNNNIQQTLIGFKANAPNLDKLTLKRELFFLFGQKKLLDRGVKKPTFLSGIPVESYRVFLKYLSEFKQNPAFQHIPQFQEKIDHILIHLKSAIENLQEPQSLNKKLLKMAAHDKEISTTGCLEHAIGVRFEKEDSSEITLFLGERGLFQNSYFSTPGSQEGKFKSIKKITFSANHILEVNDLLLKATSLSPNEAEKILFTDIPKLTGKEYQEHPDIEQAPLKAGICFSGNCLAILFLEIMDEFGKNDPLLAKDIYKSFTLYLREKSFEAFLPYIEQEDEIFVNAAKEALAEKIQAKKNS